MNCSPARSDYETGDSLMKSHSALRNHARLAHRNDDGHNDRLAALEARNDTPFVRVDGEGRIVEIIDYKAASDAYARVASSTVAVPSTIATHSESRITGSLSGTETGDVYSLN